MTRKEHFQSKAETTEGRGALIALRNSMVDHMRFLGEVYRDEDKRTREAKEALAAHAETWNEVNEINAALGIDGLAKLENDDAWKVKYALAGV